MCRDSTKLAVRSVSGDFSCTLIILGLEREVDLQKKWLRSYYCVVFVHETELLDVSHLAISRAVAEEVERDDALCLGVSIVTSPRL